MGLRERLRLEHLVLLIDLLGTSLFAAEGATTAIHARLDVLGVLVLAFVTALGGGMVRDLLLGDAPPNAIRDWRYAAVALATGLVVFAVRTPVEASGAGLVQALDAAGLSLFAVAGATKALEFKIHPLLATMLGGITGVGGGTIRDVLINKVPRVLTADVYAAAALLGAAITVALLRMGVKPAVASLLGIVGCFVVRMLAVKYRWNLPVRA